MRASKKYSICLYPEIWTNVLRSSITLDFKSFWETVLALAQEQSQPAQPSGREELSNDRAAITAVGERVIAAAERAGYSEASRFAVRLATRHRLWRSSL